MSSLTSPWKFSGVLESVSLIFSPWPGKPWHMVKLSFQTLLSPLFTLFQMCCALSFTYSFSQYLLKTYYASDGSPENRMVSETDVLLDFLLTTVWSFPDWLHAVPSIHDPRPSYYSTARPPARQSPTDSQDPAHSSSSATFPNNLGMTSKVLSSKLGNHNGHQLSATSFPSSKLYFYPATALVGGHHLAHGTTQILKYLKSVLYVFLPYPPPTLPTALTPTNTCKCACEHPKGKNLYLTRRVTYIIQVLPNRSSMQLLIY